MLPPKPKNLRWEESGTVIRLAPSAQFSLKYVGILLVVVLMAIMNKLGASKRSGVGEWIVLGGFGSLLIPIALYPWWGGTTVTFDAHTFRVGSKEKHTLAIIRQFEPASTDEGFEVFLALTGGARIKLSLPFRAPRWVASDRNETQEERRQKFRAEAEWIAARLNELLAQARAKPGAYRS